MTQIIIKVFQQEDDHFVAELLPFVGHGPTKKAAIREVMQKAELEIIPTEPIQLNFFKEIPHARPD